MKKITVEPQIVFDFFSEISEVPRESGNEEGIKNYLIAQAKKYSFDYDTDSIGNVYYYKKAAQGFEDRPTVALQGHMDMVCVKTEHSTHDFTKDGLDLYIDGDLLRAKDTTLGADNGIALAMILAIFSDPNAQHGPLEAIITVSEETGLYGAFAVEPTKIKSRKMINLDSEDEGIIFIGCAGGIEVKADKKLQFQTIPNEYCTYALKIDGLLGGHSGAEIHTNRGNAIKMASTILFYLQQKTELMLSSFTGGTRRNVIPSTCEVVFSVKDEVVVSSIIDDCNKLFFDLYEISDPNFKVTIEKVKADEALSTKESQEIITAIFLSPHGVQAYSSSLKGIVETSNNLAIIELSKAKNFTLVASARSSIERSRDLIAEQLKALWNIISEAKITIEGAYPAWKPDVSLPLSKFCATAYYEYTKKEAVVTAIHAGLECGIINSRISGMDSVSFGPDIAGAHSVNESLSIKSTQNIFGFLKHLLTIIK